MRRFATLAFLFLFTIPFGISIAGCGKKTAVVFCNGSDSGPVVGQLTSITLQPKIYGISLNTGQFGQVQTPSATDCKGSSVSVSSYTYGTSDMTLADVVPSTGRLCAGNWNRNTGGGIPDYTVCNVTGKTGVAYITATANGATSNPLPVYIHPVVTSVVLGSPSTDCIHDPASNCSAAATNSTTDTNGNPISCTVDPGTGCCTRPPVSGSAFSTGSCLSQGASGQLAARVFAGAGNAQSNISCKVGHVTYSPQTSGIVTIDENGIATAQQPGSTIISASISNAGSTAGFFSTCPPASITISTPNSTTTNGTVTATVNQNNTVPVTAVVTDTKGAKLTGLTLNYVSTTPSTLPDATGGSITPIFPGAGSITAVCQPPACNPSPLNEIGLFGNGKPVTSNAIQVNTPGSNSSILYAASTHSLYLVPVDFTTSVVGTPVRLPYVPNSMVISTDGSTIYMGSSTELMVYNAAGSGLAREDLTLPGVVLAVSPDNTTVVVSDPVRQTISLATASGGIQTTYGGVGTHAQFSPDSSTVYISAGNQIIVHSAFTGWSSLTPSTNTTDVAVTVPAVGAFFSGATTTARGYCPATTVNSSGGQTTTTSVSYPDASVVAPATDRLSATNDGVHILGATAAGPTLTDLRLNNGTGAGMPIGQCPANGSALTFSAAPVLTGVLPGVSATAITGVLPASDSSIAFVTYLGSGGVLPSYIPSTTGPGTLGSIKLSGTATAPVSGTFSSDNSTFFTGTAGDNLIHLITRRAGVFTDSSTIAPKLPDASGNLVPADLLVQRPRKTT